MNFLLQRLPGNYFPTKKDGTAGRLMHEEHGCKSDKEALWNLTDVATFKQEAYGIKEEKPKVEPVESKCSVHSFHSWPAHFSFSLSTRFLYNNEKLKAKS